VSRMHCAMQLPLSEGRRGNSAINSAQLQRQPAYLHLQRHVHLRHSCRHSRSLQPAAPGPRATCQRVIWASKFTDRLGLELLGRRSKITQVSAGAVGGRAAGELQHQLARGRLCRRMQWSG
jgi:hypothetical protein